MIIGFLGKGGSGKTTLATMYTEYLLSLGKSVLAVDADHNMDLAYNLGQEGIMNYIGQGYQDVLTHMELSSSRKVLTENKDHYFSLTPLDAVTERYSIEIKDGLRIMVAGPHTEAMMYGVSCSHGLTQPLRTYLPFLKVDEDEAVVVDEKAGADGVGTGITVGFTTAVIVAEATRHGIKAAKQIAGMLTFYNTPYVFVLNKVMDISQIKTLQTELGEDVVMHIPFRQEVASAEKGTSNDYMAKLHQVVSAAEDTRVKRAKERLQKLVDFESTTA